MSNTSRHCGLNATTQRIAQATRPRHPPTSSSDPNNCVRKDIVPRHNNTSLKLTHRFQCPGTRKMLTILRICPAHILPTDCTNHVTQLPRQRLCCSYYFPFFPMLNFFYIVPRHKVTPPNHVPNRSHLPSHRAQALQFNRDCTLPSCPGTMTTRPHNIPFSDSQHTPENALRQFSPTTPRITTTFLGLVWSNFFLFYQVLFYNYVPLLFYFISHHLPMHGMSNDPHHTVA